MVALRNGSRTTWHKIIKQIKSDPAAVIKMGSMPQVFITQADNERQYNGSSVKRYKDALEMPHRQIRNIDIIQVFTRD